MRSNRNQLAAGSGRAGSATLWAATVLLAFGGLGHAAVTTGTQTQDMSGILGPGSQLMASENGEFEILFDDDNQLGHFRATRDVVLLTKEIEMQCEELLYRRSEGTIEAEAKPGRQIAIRMIGAPGAEEGGGPNKDVRAWCDHYKLLVNEKRHILTGKGKKPEVHQTDDKGKVMAFAGRNIVMTQRENGSWRIDVKGEPEIFDPSQRDKLREARQSLGSTPPGGPAPRPTSVKPPAPVPTPAPATTTRAPSIETGSGEPRKPARPREMKIDDGL